MWWGRASLMTPEPLQGLHSVRDKGVETHSEIRHYRVKLPVLYFSQSYWYWWCWCHSGGVCTQMYLTFLGINCHFHSFCKRLSGTAVSSCLHLSFAWEPWLPNLEWFATHKSTLSTLFDTENHRKVLTCVVLQMGCGYLGTCNCIHFQNSLVVFFVFDSHLRMSRNVMKTSFLWRIGIDIQTWFILFFCHHSVWHSQKPLHKDFFSQMGEKWCPVSHMPNMYRKHWEFKQPKLSHFADDTCTPMHVKSLCTESNEFSSRNDDSSCGVNNSNYSLLVVHGS